jgi:hypothetical protein
MTILKQLIENMIGEYLNESYEDDLVESVFEEVSEETWEAIEEAILNELSPELRDRYAAAASKSLKKASDARSRSAPGGNAYKKHDDTMKKRRKGSAALGVRRDAESGAEFQYMDPKDQKNRTDRISKRVQSDLKNLSADEFNRRYRMSKAEWERKNK